MAQLDQLIGAMFRHSAEAVMLAEGEKPALVIDGSARPVAKQSLDASQVLRLVAEVAPATHRERVDAGIATRFAYEGAGTTVEIELEDGPRVTIRPARAERAPIPLSDVPDVPLAREVPPPGPPPAAKPAAKPATPPPAPAAKPAATAPTAAAMPAAPPPAPAARIEVAPPVSASELRLDRLLHELVGRGGSDLHVSSTCPPMIRIDGELRELDGFPTLDGEGAERLLLAVAPERNRSEFADVGDTDFAYEITGLARFRCNLFRDQRGTGGVMRVIPSRILGADELGLSQQIQSLAQLTKGLVLVTGPTGSGKSTTLAALVDLVNSTRAEHIITIEDPIEFVHPNKRCLVNQRQVFVHTRSFKAALRAALREDPDVVLVGELRDLETVGIAIETAETGHLVFGTLHTNSAVSTVDRLIDQFPGDEQERIRVMLSESLKAVIAQVLCRKVSGGRVAAHEVLMVNPAVSNLIREGKTFQIPSIMQTSRKLGMVTMNEALTELVQSKTIEPREAYLKAVDKASLLTTFRSRHIPIGFLASTESAVREPEPA
jgi:twitching motility protein PilT